MDDEKDDLMVDLRVRVRPTQKKLIEDAASRTGLSMSAAIRAAAIAWAKQVQA
jgi:uncharacterized protein (DUF1778 family)